MKQKIKRRKTNSSGNAIRTILQEELKNFATKQDLFLLKTDASALKTDISNFKIDVLVEINRIELKAIDRGQNYHSDVMTEFDKIIKKLETISQENIISESQQDQKLENHKGRIKILESSQKS